MRPRAALFEKWLRLGHIRVVMIIKSPRWRRRVALLEHWLRLGQISFVLVVAALVGDPLVH